MKPWKDMPWTEGRAVMALAHRFDYRQNWIFPNVHFGLCEMDLAVVTRRARKLWEIEVKLSMADWRADAKKRKWTDKSRRFISRFYYAITPEMADAALWPAFVPPEAGVLALGPYIKTLREARAARTPSITDAQLQSLMTSTYFRFWRERAVRHHHARGRVDRAAEAAESEAA